MKTWYHAWIAQGQPGLPNWNEPTENSARVASWWSFNQLTGHIRQIGKDQLQRFQRELIKCYKETWKDVKDAIPKTHEILHRVRELENVKGELKGELKAELKDVKDAQGKLEGELKEIRKVLEDLSDKFNLLE